MFDNKLRFPSRNFFWKLYKNIKSHKICGKNLEYLKSDSKKNTSVVPVWIGLRFYLILGLMSHVTIITRMATYCPVLSVVFVSKLLFRFEA